MIDERRVQSDKEKVRDRLARMMVRQQAGGKNLKFKSSSSSTYSSAGLKCADNVE